MRALQVAFHGTVILVLTVAVGCGNTSALPEATPTAASVPATAPADQPTATAASTSTPAIPEQAAVPDVVVYMSELPESAIFELRVVEDPVAAGGKLLGLNNNGDELDPPPENDPHVIFTATVAQGVPYRCWVHMKVGAPKGKSQANVVWVQFSDAVDQAKNTIFVPGSGDYLTAQGPTQEGWVWVACNLKDTAPAPALVQFQKSDITIRIQAGMEGVGFDQILLSAARFLESPPAEAIVAK